MINVMILEQWFLTTFIEALANFQEGLKMTLIIQNKAKQTLPPPPPPPKKKKSRYVLF